MDARSASAQLITIWRSIPARTGDYRQEEFAKGGPLNHVGVEVPNLEETEGRVIEAGLTPFGHEDYEPGRRFYFLDPDGIEYEVVSYDRSERVRGE